ncbi:hypothetical protein NDS46_03800 [Paenibacillus thiaminolyticus]|uniref:hypothetical protein n=1 Tax=Paenibacillus thiaminolyticus TaxID=49283 RepID=UPI00232BFB3C|nr:hypothetical protein [Paenibacillus thiaminolyticus]WCF09045.1 hypothetical protein NDS46_03800 [Paenibacillus thiaminolyticus]
MRTIMRALSFLLTGSLTGRVSKTASSLVSAADRIDMSLFRLLTFTLPFVQEQHCQVRAKRTFGTAGMSGLLLSPLFSAYIDVNRAHFEFIFPDRKGY